MILNQAVWGSCPCNLGISASYKRPRLGPLLPLENDLSNISALYFQKHGAYTEIKSVQVVGKRMVIRIPQKLDIGSRVEEEGRAVLPAPEGRARRPKGD